MSDGVSETFGFLCFTARTMATAAIMIIAAAIVAMNQSCVHMGEGGCPIRVHMLKCVTLIST